MVFVIKECPRALYCENVAMVMQGCSVLLHEQFKQCCNSPPSHPVVPFPHVHKCFPADTLPKYCNLAMPFVPLGSTVNGGVNVRVVWIQPVVPGIIDSEPRPPRTFPYTYRRPGDYCVSLKKVRQLWYANYWLGVVRMTRNDEEVGFLNTTDQERAFCLNLVKWSAVSSYRHVEQELATLPCRSC